MVDGGLDMREVSFLYASFYSVRLGQRSHHRREKNKERKKRKSKKHDRKKKALTWLEETENGRKPANKKYVSSAAPTWVYM